MPNPSSFSCKSGTRLRLGALALCASLLAASAWADIYKYTDDEGRVTFSNIPMRGATKVYSEMIPMGSRPHNANAKGTNVQRVNAPSPADFPKVDSSTQRSRDSNRRKILEDELATERQSLTDARKALADAQAAPGDAQLNPAKYNDRIMRLRDNATVHEKNVDALTAELAKSK
ncbi:hypothetical protein JCM19000A_15410 [Silvimonas sp. JCM 19000]